MSGQQLKTTTALAVALTLLASAPTRADTSPVAPPALDIPEQSLIDAIAALGAATGQQIIGADEMLRGKRSAAISGVMSAKDALARMLNDPTLALEETPGGTLIITPAAEFNIASQNAADPVDLGTLVLTGERVVRDVFTTASSVRAVSSAEIEENVQSNDVERSIAETANVIVIGNSNQTPVIRGQSSAGPVVGAGAAFTGQLPRANLTVDGRVVSFNELAYSPTSVWDVETIEVFRGPQTTSQGANSIAGAINIRTKDPVFVREASAQLQVGSNEKTIAGLMANTPLSDDVALRFTYEYQFEEPYVEFRGGLSSSSRANKTELETARLKLLWEPASIPELSTKLTFAWTDFNRPQTQNVFNDADADWADLEAAGGFNSAFFGEALTFVHDIDYDLGSGFSVRNQISYSESDSTRATGDPAEGDGLIFNSYDLSNELVLDYAPEGGALSGVFGIYYRDSSDTATGIAADNIRTGFGVFSEATYRLGNGFDVTGGLRYQRDTQERDIFVPAGTLGNAVDIDVEYDGDFEEWLPKLAIGYEPNDDLRFTAQYSRGFNPGGLTGPIRGIALGVPGSIDDFDQETVDNFELGMRGRFLEDTLFVSANLFYSKFEGYQYGIPVLVQVPAGFTLADTQIGNSDGVEAYGLELEAQYQATDDLKLSGSFGWLHSEVTEFKDNPGVEGNLTPFAPTFTAALGVDYYATDALLVGARVNFKGEYYSDIDNTEDATVDPITTLDVRATYAFDNGLELFGYVNNVSDVIKPVQIFPTGDFGVTTKPREFGFGIRYSM